MQKMIFLNLVVAVGEHNGNRCEGVLITTAAREDGCFWGTRPIKKNLILVLVSRCGMAWHVGVCVVL